MYLISSFSKTKRVIALVFSLLCFGKTEAQRTVDSLQALLPGAVGVDRMELSYGLFVEYLGQDKMDKALFYAEMAGKVSTELQDTLRMVRSYNAIGFIRRETGKLKAAVSDFNAALRLAELQLERKVPEEEEYRKQRNYILNNLGTSYMRLSEYAKAMEVHFRSLKLREQEKDTLLICVALNNIGYNYKQLGDIENALSYYRQSYEIMVKAKIDFELEIRLINMADASNSIGLYEETKKYMKDVFARCAGRCEERILGLAHHTFGIALLRTGELEEAERQFLLALKIWQNIDYPDEIGELNSLAEVSFEKGDYNRALDYLDESEDLSDETDFLQYHLQNYKLYARIYTVLKDYKLAADYRSKYQELYERIFNNDLLRNLTRIQSKYLEAENLATIERQGSEIELNRRLIAAQRNQVIFFTVVCFLIIGLVFLLWRFTLAQRKSNKALMTAKSTIEKQNRELTEINRTLDQRILDKTQELVSANISLQRSNEEMDHFVYKTSHDIRGPLASLKGIASLALIESKDEEVTRYIRMLDETADGLIRILTRMVSISQITHTKLQPQQLSLQSLVNDSLNIQNKRGFPKNLEINAEVQADLALITDRNLVSIVLDNLLDNAIKFRNTSERAGSFIRIRVQAVEGGVSMEVTDNGIGIDKSNADKIFQMFVRASERSATGGLGLYLSRLAVEKLGGTISLHITPEGWTQFRVILPIDLGQVIETRRQQEIQHEMEHLKFRLVAMTSHEMRTPLASIQASTESLALRLQSTEIGNRDDIRRNLARIQEEVSRVTAIINDILTGHRTPK